MKPLRLKVKGDFALFTRPEAKVERVSYPIMTPSAARGVLESILWKPEISWQVLKIEVLKKPMFYSIVRNEVASKATINKAIMNHPDHYFADDDRQLRHSLLLKDVAYIIEAQIHLQPNVDGSIEKYRAMFRRRVEKGQCFHRPYLGSRECVAQFSTPTDEDAPINWTEELGQIFYDYRYPKNGLSVIPYFFQAEIREGILEVPNYLYEEVTR